MKKLFYTTFLFIGIAGANAQPVLTSGNMAPFGTTAPISVAAPSSFNPGSSGANQTWDFSSMTTLPAGNVTIVNPSTTPFAATYSTSNYAYKLDMTVPVAATVYNYYTVSNSAFELLASEVGSADPNVYPDARPELKFPFVFNDTYSETYQTTNMGSPETLTRTYDGYGTLITPTATYTNAVRIAFTYPGEPTRYEWLLADPLMLLVHENEDGTLIFIGANPLAVDDAYQIGYDVVPTFVSNGFAVIRNASLVESAEIIDITGRLTLKFHQPVGGILDLSSLSAGVYNVRLNGIDGQSRVRKIVVQ